MSHPECKVDLTKPNITDYTEYEFFKVVRHMYEYGLGDEWQAKAEAMVARVVACPDPVSMIMDRLTSYRGIDEIKMWYEERGLPCFKPETKIPITEYTEKEFMQILEDIAACEGTEEENDDLVNLFDNAVEHPEGINLIYWPKVPDNSSENIIAEIKRWYKENNKPCFKPE